jgi:hypothetical protein
VRLVAGPHLELAAVERERGAARDAKRQLEADLGHVGLGQLAFERGQAASLRPHAVRDRAPLAERLGGQPVQVDRVGVARHARVAAPDVARHAPDRTRGRRLRPVAATGAAPAFPPQIGAAAAPHGLALDGRLRADVELRPALMAAQFGRPHAQVEPLVRMHRPQELNPVDDVHESERRQRE